MDIDRHIWTMVSYTVKAYRTFDPEQNIHKTVSQQ